MQPEQDLLKEIRTQEASIASQDNQLKLKFAQRVTRPTTQPLNNILS